MPSPNWKLNKCNEQQQQQGRQVYEIYDYAVPLDVLGLADDFCLAEYFYHHPIPYPFGPCLVLSSLFLLILRSFSVLSGAEATARGTPTN